MREMEIGEQSDLRDAYLFAAPILSDRDSVEGNRPRHLHAHWTPGILNVFFTQYSMLR